MRTPSRLRGVLTIGASLLALAACGSVEPQPPAYIVFFTPFSTELDPAAQAVVTDAAKVARAQPGREIRVLGFAAPSPETTAQADLLLSQKRSLRVTNALVSQGIAQSRIVQLPKGSVGGDPGVESRRVEIEFGS